MFGVCGWNYLRLHFHLFYSLISPRFLMFPILTIVKCFSLCILFHFCFASLSLQDFFFFFCFWSRFRFNSPPTSTTSGTPLPVLFLFSLSFSSFHVHFILIFSIIWIFDIWLLLFFFLLFVCLLYFVLLLLRVGPWTIHEGGRKRARKWFSLR